MAEYFAGGHLRFIDGEWRDDNGDVVNIKEEKYGYNITEAHPVDEFICSVCRFVSEDCNRCEYDEDADDWSHYEYEFKYCPNCGVKIKNQ